MIFKLSLKDDKQSTMAIVRGSTLPEVGTAYAKVLSGEGEEVGKSLKLRGSPGLEGLWQGADWHQIKPEM